jgi:hypothetical protein
MKKKNEYCLNQRHAIAESLVPLVEESSDEVVANGHECVATPPFLEEHPGQSVDIVLGL